jgi:hypothetical protein
MRVLIASMALVLLAGFSANASDWIVVTGMNSDDMVLLDRHSASENKGMISLMLKHFKEGDSYTKSKVEFDCAKGKYRKLEVVEYDGKEKQSTTTAPEPKWEKNAPNSPEKAVYSMICKKNKKNNPVLMYMTKND